MGDQKISALKIGEATWIGEGSGRPHGKGNLILPNGSVHHGNFEQGRANGPGVLYDATGAVMTGSWVDNKRVGAFEVIDPKGGSWADTYDSDGKRSSRKKQAPPPEGAVGAQRCGHCGVKFHEDHNSCCRQHTGKWLQVNANDEDSEGRWLCCGSTVKQGGNVYCTIGLHSVSARAEEVVLSHSEDGEVVISSNRRREVPKTDAPLADDWRDRARDSLLKDAPFVCEDGLVWLDAGKNPSLAPLASLAECGRTGCACLRTLYPAVRTRFRQEVVRFASAAREAGSLPSDGIVTYASFGSGVLLGDLDVLCGLQEAGFTIDDAAFVDLEYGNNGHAQAIAELGEYLSPARIAPYSSAAEYAVARAQGKQPAAQIFVQIDSDEISEEEAIAFSAVALKPNGGGLGFRLANQHHPTELPMISWRTIPTDGEPLENIFEQLSLETKDQDAPLDADTTYGELLKRLDAQSLITVERAPITR